MSLVRLLRTDCCKCTAADQHNPADTCIHTYNMHIQASTSLVALLVAASALASPLANSIDHQQQPFLAGQPVQQHAAVSTPSDDHLPSLESFQALLGSLDYARLVEHVDSLPERRLIALSEHAEDRQFITEGQKALLTFHGIKFIDITESALLENEPSASQFEINKGYDDAAFPSNWTYGRHKLDKRFYENIDTSRMKGFLQAFSSFRTRYYRSNDGRQSQLFLLDKIQQIVSEKKNKHLRMSVEEFPHPWGQNSLIVKLPANDTANAKGTVVVGAHQDSTNLLPFLSAP